MLRQFPTIRKYVFEVKRAFLLIHRDLRGERAVFGEIKRLREGVPAKVNSK